MATYLDLCRKVALESGTIPSQSDPLTTVGQTGRLYRLCQWTADAYSEIQRESAEWRWLQSEFSGQTISGTQRYNAAALGIASRFSRWVHKDEDQANLFSLYLTSAGQAEEGFLTVLDWEEFRRRCTIGAAATQTGKPVVMAIDTSNQIALHPIPDAAYTLRGYYQKSAQILAADADVPEMPEEYHQAIVWGALMLLGLFDEAGAQMPMWAQKYKRVIADLKISQLPRIRLSRAFA